MAICTKQIDQKNTENEKVNTKRPFFIIKEVSFDREFTNNLWEYGQNSFSCFYYKGRHAFIKIVNVGDGVANNLTIEPWGMGDLSREMRPALCVQQQSFCVIPIYLSEKNDQYTKFIQITYENIIGYAYSQKIEFCIGFNPEIIGKVKTENGEIFPEFKERYCANVFNIYPQIPLGMNKYDSKKGKYNM